MSVVAIAGVTLLAAGLLPGEPGDVREGGAIETHRAADSPAEPLVVDVTGKDFAWHFRYPAAADQTSAAGAVDAGNDLHVPLGRKVELRLSSADYIYIFSLPQSNGREIAVPELTYRLEFLPQQVGEYEILVDPLCGYRPQHDDVMGRLHVMAPADFERWLADRASRSSRKQ